MKTIVFLCVLGTLFINKLSAQWSSFSGPIFQDPNQICEASDYIAAGGGCSTFYWAYNVGCGSGSSFYTYFRVFTSTDAGENWSQTYTGNSEYDAIYAMEYISPDTGYIVRNQYGAGVIQRTSNGGYGYQGIHYVDYPEFQNIKMKSYNEIFAIKVDGRFYALEDDTLKIKHDFPDSLNFSKVKIQIAGNNKIFIACKTEPGNTTYNDLILCSSDNGTTWDTSYISQNCYFSNLLFFDNDFGIAVGTEGKIIKTEDSGETWIMKETGVTNTLHSVDYMNDSMWIAVGSYGTILISYDRGESWEHISSPTSSGIAKVSCPGRCGLVIIRSGTNYWKAILPGYVEIQENPGNDNFCSVFPNPTDEFINISVKSILPNTTLEITNLFSELYYSDQLTQPVNRIDLSALPAGVYLLKISNKVQSQVQKLLIQ